jgi:hypothetical protein
MVMTHFNDVYRQIQMLTKRTAQMQAQADFISARVARIEKG